MVGEDPVLLAQDLAAAEKKRIRGVLAQRRYRQRKKALKADNRGRGQIQVASHEFHGADPEDEMWDNSIALAGLDAITYRPQMQALDFGLGDLVGTQTSPGSLDSRPYSNFTSLTPVVSDSPNATSASLTVASSLSKDLSTDSNITMPELGLMKAHVVILKTLIAAVGMKTDVSTIIWNPFATSPFHNGETNLANLGIIPENYRPTALQLKHRHHPIIDLLPWPGARDQLLRFLSLPWEARPPILQDSDENIAIKLKYDMLDADEGVRVFGHNAFRSENWEIGQTFFEHWFWLFSNSILREVNGLRLARGVESLKLRPKR